MGDAVRFAAIGRSIPPVQTRAQRLLGARRWARGARLLSFDANDVLDVGLSSPITGAARRSRLLVLVILAISVQLYRHTNAPRKLAPRVVCILSYFLPLSSLGVDLRFHACRLGLPRMRPSAPLAPPPGPSLPPASLPDLLAIFLRLQPSWSQALTTRRSLGPNRVPHASPLAYAMWFEFVRAVYACCPPQWFKVRHM